MIVEREVDDDSGHILLALIVGDVPLHIIYKLLRHLRPLGFHLLSLSGILHSRVHPHLLFFSYIHILCTLTNATLYKNSYKMSKIKRR